MHLITRVHDFSIPSIVIELFLKSVEINDEKETKEIIYDISLLNRRCVQLAICFVSQTEKNTVWQECVEIRMGEERKKTRAFMFFVSNGRVWEMRQWRRQRN